MPEVTTVEEMVGVVDLQDVQCIEEHARRIVWTDGKPDRDLPEQVNAIGVTAQESQLHYRLKVRFTDTTAEYVADWMAVVTHAPETTFPEPVLREYGQRVAFFTLFPFIRASIYGSASRLNQPVPVLGLVRQGELDDGEDMTPTEAQSVFNVGSGDTRQVTVESPTTAS